MADPPVTISGIRNLSDLCQVATFIISDPAFQAVLVLASGIGLLAVCLNVCLMYNIWKVTVFHANLRCLLFHHSFNLTIFSLGFSIKACYMLSLWLILGQPCRLVTSLFDCKVQEMFYIVPLVNSIYSLIVLCIERLYATFTFRTYDLGSSKPWLACFLIPCVWLIVLVNQCLPLLDIPKNVYMPLCSNLLTISPALAKQILTPNMIVESLAVIMTVSLYFINKNLLEKSSINRAKHTLAARFQLSQNVMVNRLLLPTAAVHAGCFMAQYTYLFLILTGLNLDENTKMMLVNTNYLFLLSYSLVHPTLAFLLNPHLKKLSHNWTVILPKCMKKEANSVGIQRASAMVQANIHFKALEDMWNVGESEKTVKHRA